MSADYEVRFIFHRVGDEGLVGVERSAGIGSKAWAEDARRKLVSEGADAWVEQREAPKSPPRPEAPVKP